MLTVTDAASEAITALSSAEGKGESGGLRFAVHAESEEGATLAVSVASEPTDGDEVVKSEQGAQVLKAVGSPHVKMLFDVYHQQISEGNLTGNIRKYKDLIGYFQIADHPGRNEPGTGEINYPHVLRVIHDIGYTGAIGMEMSPKSDPALAFKALRKADAEARERG